MDLSSYLMGKNSSSGGSSEPLTITAGTSDQNGGGYLRTFESIPELKVTGTATNYMFYMYYGSSIPKLTGTENVTDMSNMFKSTYKLEEVVLDCDTSNVTTMEQMFASCTGTYKVDLSKLNTNKVKNASKMFYSCNYLAVIDLSNFDLTKITSYSNMFGSCGTSCKQTKGAYADGLPYVYVKDVASQNWILNKTSNFRPSGWTSDNVIVKNS